VTLLSIQGCGGNASAAASSPGHIVVTQSQAQAIYQSYLQISDDAAAAGAMATGLDVVTNSAWEATHAEYISMQTTGVPVLQYQYGTPQYFIPRLDVYPHWFVVAVPRSVSGSAPVTTLMIFAQLSKGEKWTLNGVAALAAGQSLPDIPRDSDGYVTALPTTDQSLLVRPDVVGAMQAAVVDEGPANPAAQLIDAGSLTTDWYTKFTAQTASAAAQGLVFSWFMEGTTYPVYSLRTADGGALVLYGMTVETTTEHPNHVLGAAIPVPAGLASLMPAGQIAYHAYYVTETWQFATTDPPAGAAHARMAVIAASGGPSYVHSY
jgi:hypothetical protein